MAPGLSQKRLLWVDHRHLAELVPRSQVAEMQAGSEASKAVILVESDTDQA
jgi:hypothetical protein